MTPPLDSHMVWLRRWQKTGPALEAVKKQELAGFDYTRHRRLVDAMLQWACDHRQTRSTSGLVEQQRLFGLLKDPADRHASAPRSR